MKLNDENGEEKTMKIMEIFRNREGETYLKPRFRTINDGSRGQTMTRSDQRRWMMIVEEEEG